MNVTTGTSLALIGELETAGALSPVGLRLSEEMSFDNFESMMGILGAVHKSMQFAVGDAIIYGEQLFGEEVYQAIESTHLSPDTLNRYRRTAERVPIGRRRVELSWSHHFLVATLPPEEQIEWLEKAVVNNYSKAELEALLKTPKDPKDKYVSCPECGATFQP